MSFFRDCCPNCGAWIEQRTEGQNAAFHSICTRLAHQIDWPKGSGRKIDTVAWKRLLVAAYERTKGRGPEIYPSLDRDGFDVVYTRTSRMTKQEMAELIPMAEALSIELGVVFDEERAA